MGARVIAGGVGRGEVTDAAWDVIASLLPANGRRGQQWADHRTVVNGILGKVRTGAPWRDLLERYGPWRTAYARFRRWQRDGTWDRSWPTPRPAPTRSGTAR